MTYQNQFFSSLHWYADIPLPQRTPDLTPTPNSTPEETPPNIVISEKPQENKSKEIETV